MKTHFQHHRQKVMLVHCATLKKTNDNETHDDHDQHVLCSDPKLSALTEDDIDYSIMRNYHKHQLHSKNNNNDCEFASIKKQTIVIKLRNEVTRHTPIMVIMRHVILW